MKNGTANSATYKTAASAGVASGAGGKVYIVYSSTLADYETR